MESTPTLEQPISTGNFSLKIPAVLLGLAAVSLVTIDYPVSMSATSHGWTGELHRALLSIEPYGSPYGIAVVLLAILSLSRERMRDAIHIGTVGVAGGLSAGLVKLLVSRTRPDHFNFLQDHIFDSYQGVLPMMRGGSAQQSFPSAHTATAVAFAVALAHYFPQAKWLCFSLAAIVGIQRIEAGQHFPSDVLVGAAVGWTVGNLLLAMSRRESAASRMSIPCSPHPTQHIHIGSHFEEKAALRGCEDG
ncbi:MAG: phosphatase PAP2 family protein [Planctomycetaceae bacterium]|nr:phosphatase PAP2 family protein [Planctomycetaceae bacterium]